MPDFAVYVVSMDKDHEKFRAAKDILSREGFADVTRVRGVPGSTLPNVGCDILTKTSNYSIGKGALGCFLAHASAWEQIAASNAAWCIVFEDDVRFHDLGMVPKLAIPADAHLIFCNDYMQPEVEPGVSPGGAMRTAPISLCLKKMVRRRYNGIGTQGYFLSRSGAQRLVDAVRRDGFFGHVDWRLMRYCTTEAIIDDAIPGTRVAYVLRHHHNQAHPPAWGILNGYVATRALVAHDDVASNRKAEDVRSAADA